jgi:hypothetical protein
MSGKTLTGRSLELPAAATGRPTVVVFSFSRTANKDAHQWNEHLTKEFTNGVPLYEVIVLESVPKLFRGTLTSLLERSNPNFQLLCTIDDCEGRRDNQAAANHPNRRGIRWRTRLSMSSY